MKNHIASAAVLLFFLYASTVFASDGGKLSTAINDFSQRLDGKIRKEGESVVYSPYSIHSALAMASVGAKGETLKEMRSVLSLTTLGDATNSAYHDLIKKLNSAPYATVKTGNALFCAPDLELKNTFRNEVETQYLGNVSKFDFGAKGGPEKAVNDYVEKKTNGMIKNMLDEGSVDGSTIMILINTLFFNGTWANTFEEGWTDEQDFHVDGETKKVKMMHTEEDFDWKYDSDISSQVLKMDFFGRRFALYIVLPKEHETDINSLEKALDGMGITGIFQGLANIPLRVNVPKFKIATKLDMTPILKDLGMKQAFGTSADFSGISDDVELSPRLDKVIHQAVIEVRETGTVAAAATVGIMPAMSRPRPEQQFTADHPFLFFLRNSETGQVLFRGKFTG